MSQKKGGWEPLVWIRLFVFLCHLTTELKKVRFLISSSKCLNPSVGICISVNVTVVLFETWEDNTGSWMLHNNMTKILLDVCHCGRRLQHFSRHKNNFSTCRGRKKWADEEYKANQYRGYETLKTWENEDNVIILSFHLILKRVIFWSMRSQLCSLWLKKWEA